MTKNLSLFERGVRIALALIFGWLWFFAPVSPLVKVILFVITVVALWEGLAGRCPLYAQLGMKKSGDNLGSEKLYLLGVLGTQLTLAYLWWHAGWEKVTGTFLADLPKTLAFFASKNPFPWYKNFILNTAIPNADTFGPLVQWGELLVGAGLMLAVVIIAFGQKQQRLAYGVSAVALAAGALMNANFWVAAGWTGPATAGSNVVMFWPSLFLAYIWLARLREA